MNMMKKETLNLESFLMWPNMFRNFHSLVTHFLANDALMRFLIYWKIYNLYFLKDIAWRCNYSTFNLLLWSLKTLGKKVEKSKGAFYVK